MRKTRENNDRITAPWVLIGLLLIATAAITPSQAQQFSSNINTNSFVLELSNEAQEAINNGVSLTFDCDFAFRQSFWLFTLNKEIKQHQFRIVRHALSNRYIVHRDNLQRPHIFRSIDEATNFIVSQSMKLLKSYNETEKPFAMKLSLNKFALPGPMRLNAFISSAWTLNTGWIEWHFAN